MDSSIGSPASSQLLSTREAAAVLGVHERTVRRYIASGELAHGRLPGGQYRIAREAIDELLACGPKPGPARDAPKAPAPRAAPRRSRTHKRRGSGSRYDLSAATLAALRAQTEPRRG